MKLTQHDRILKYIIDFGSITTLEAFTELGISKLTTRISELRAKGFNIIDKQESSKNRWGEVCHYNRYFLEMKNAESANC
jgi:hypothetical protein